MGYHVRKIPRGTWKEFSKIEEEFMELLDSHEQGVKIMELCELADLYGAIKGYIENKYNMTMEDLEKMNERTSEAFKDGTRTPRDADSSSGEVKDA